VKKTYYSDCIVTTPADGLDRVGLETCDRMKQKTNGKRQTIECLPTDRSTAPTDIIYELEGLLNPV
jgi:hypothetical protein